MSARALVLAAAAALALALIVAAAAPAAAPTWRLEQPIPPGTGSAGPVGPVAALRFVSPSRGLLQTQGTGGGSPAGLWTYDGRDWTLLASVCGAEGDHGAIAIAGPDELWTVSDPATRTPAPGSYAGDLDLGTTLCHFRDGRVVDSYAVPATEPTRTFAMHAATCRAPDDCWFAGDYGVTPDASHAGVFHLHWDGSELRRVFAASDHAASGLAVFDGAVWETTLEGRRQWVRTREQPDEAAAPALLHTLGPGGRADDPLRLSSAAVDPVYEQSSDDALHGSELDLNAVTANADGSDLWAVGNGARSGPWWGIGYVIYPNDLGPAVPPVGAVRLPGGAFEQLRFDAGDTAQLSPTLTAYYNRLQFADVAPIPGSDHEAWIALVSASPKSQIVEGPRQEASRTLPQVLRVRYTLGVAAGLPNAQILETILLPAPSGRGAVHHVACPAAGECWASTSEGWLYHWTDGTAQPRDTDPAYARLIAIRPPDGRTPQPLPDDDPLDDSHRFAPAPDVITVAPPPAPDPAPGSPPTQKIGALISAPKARAIGRDRIAVRFELTRPAMVGLAGELYGRVVARARERRLVPGDQEIVLRVEGGRRPKRLRFATKELALTAPTLTTAATRTAAGVSVRVAAPAAGRLTVTVVAAGHATVLARKTATLRAGAPARTLAVAMPRAQRSGSLTVRFALRLSSGAALPFPLAAQRLLDAPPRPTR